MIQTQSMLDVADNSGARRVMCITVFVALTVPSFVSTATLLFC